MFLFVFAGLVMMHVALVGWFRVWDLCARTSGKSVSITAKI